MDVTTKKCDVCGRLKQEVNHWFIAFTVPGHKTITFGLAEEEIAFKKNNYAGIAEDICGYECIQKRLSQYLEAMLALKGRL